MQRLKDARLCYLATPYSKYPNGIEAAFRMAAKTAARLLQAGARCYSPIAHTHPIAIYGQIDPLAHDIWLPFDSAMMDAADVLVVAMLPTWRDSYGIRHEIDTFAAAGKPVFYLDPDTLRVATEA